MTDETGAGGKGGPRLDRRALLIGGGVGVAATAAVGAGANAVRRSTASFTAPKPVGKGEAADIALSYADSRPMRTEAPKAPKGAPNIVVIILDDVGIADLGCYGGEIETPHIDALAAGGLRYANFRTTAMCSCTRAALLTGLNHHSAGMGWLADIDSGYPGYRGDLTLEAATLPEVLKDAGWSTFLSGKWHVNYVGSNGPTGPFHNWPTSRGFEHAYWFQGHSTDYWKPGALFDGLAPVERETPADYYVTDDLTDRAIGFIRAQKAMAPDKPFYLQLAHTGAHSPLQAKPEDRDRYKGRFDKGWDAVRRERLDRQKQLGLAAETTQLPPLSFGADPWDGLSPLQKKIYARYMEVYAGCITAVDRSIGRLMAELEALGVREDTLVMLFSDNGGSPEGGPKGTPNVIATATGVDLPLEEVEKLYDIMGEDGTFPHYPMGWANASNTPYRLYKQYTALGGVADPLIISWPKGIKDKGAVRKQFVHVVDLHPTLLEAAGVERPEAYLGRPQKPLEGASFKKTFGSVDAPTRTEQYFELGGYRAYQDGKWRAVTLHQRGSDFAKDVWTLFDLETDPNELNDLAAQNPEVVKTLAAKWHEAAKAHNVYPLDDRPLVTKLTTQKMKDIRPRWDIRPPLVTLPGDVAPLVCGLDHSFEIDLVRPAAVKDGVLVSHGSSAAGYVIYLKGGRLFYETSLLPDSELIDGGPVPAGKVVIRYVQTMTKRPYEGSGALFIDGAKRAGHVFRRVLVTPSYDGFSVGCDPGGQVSKAYQGWNRFAGTIERVQIEVKNRAPTAAEAAAFLKRQKLGG